MTSQEQTALLDPSNQATTADEQRALPNGSNQMTTSQERSILLNASPRRAQLGGDRYHLVVPPGAVRIDRGTVLGNPYPESIYGLDACLDWCQRFIDGDPAAVDEARRIMPTGRPLWKSWRTNGLVLVRLAADRVGTKAVACWCEPAARCHGDLLLAAIDRLTAGDQP